MSEPEHIKPIINRVMKDIDNNYYSQKLDKLYLIFTKQKSYIDKNGWKSYNYININESMNKITSAINDFIVAGINHRDFIEIYLKIMEEK